MMKRKGQPRFAIGLLLAALPLLAGPLQAEPTGASFLSLNPGARGEAMGSAFTAVADDASAAYWNPGGLSFFTSRELLASHQTLFSDSRTEYLGLAWPTRAGTFGFSGLYAWQDEFERRDGSGQKAGTFDAGGAMLAATFSNSIAEFAGTGITLKYVRESLDSATAEGLAFDAGFLMDAPLPGLRFGAAVRNLGPSLKFQNESYRLPSAVSVGSSYWFGSGRRNALSLEWSRLLYDGAATLSLGSEYFPYKLLAFRAGYSFSLSGAGPSGDRDPLGGFSIGMGLNFQKYQLDYAFVPATERSISAMQKTSLRVKF